MTIKIQENVHLTKNMINNMCLILLTEFLKNGQAQLPEMTGKDFFFGA